MKDSYLNLKRSLKTRLLFILKSFLPEKLCVTIFMGNFCLVFFPIKQDTGRENTIMVKKIFNQFTGSRIILPWHREKLKEHHGNMTKKESTPSSRDEQGEELFQLTIEKSLNEGLEIELSHLAENIPLKTRGIVKKIDTLAGEIYLLTEKGLLKISRKNILEVKE